MSDEQTSKPKLSYNVVPMTSELLLIADFFSVMIALYISFFIYDFWLVSSGNTIFSWISVIQAILIAVIPAPFVLYDKHFGAIVSRGTIGKMLGTHILRFIILAGFIVLLTSLIQIHDRFPLELILIWAATSIILTSAARLVMAYMLRRYQRQGALIEVIAVVGAGPVADRLVEALQKSYSDTVELLGVFDDKIQSAPESKIKATGSINDLIDLGQTRKIDWILLTLPPTADRRILEIVERLKTLSLPIGLCPQHVGLTIPYGVVDFVDDTIPVSLLVDYPTNRWNAIIKSTENFIPRWIITMLVLPFMAINALLNKFFRTSMFRVKKS